MAIMRQNENTKTRLRRDNEEKEVHSKLASINQFIKASFFRALSGAFRTQSPTCLIETGAAWVVAAGFPAGDRHIFKGKVGTAAGPAEDVVVIRI